MEATGSDNKTLLGKIGNHIRNYAKQERLKELAESWLKRPRDIEALTLVNSCQILHDLEVSPLTFGSPYAS